MHPIIIFSSQRQAQECLLYWKRILNLNDWIINIYLHYNHSVIAPDWGKSKIFRAMHTAEIHIPMPFEGQINNFPEKYTQEGIIVHELCHIRLPSLDIEVESTESEFYEAEAHANLEFVAKGLLMAKYGVTMPWFNNF